jgi:mannitol operon transcriptional antiterminator
MTHITTRQRDLIQILTNADSVLGISTIADQMGLSARQVQYDLVQIKHWLQSKNMELTMKPGVGVRLAISDLQKQQISNELRYSNRVQLILSSKQRQQLLVFLFLVADDALILNHLQYVLQVSRTTILKDIETVEDWFRGQQVNFLRRQNFGFQLECPEKRKREMITLFLWGEETVFEAPLLHMSHIGGLEFELVSDVEKLPVLSHVNEIIQAWNTKKTIRRVTFAEAQLGGRFTDDAVLFLSLVFTIQANRILKKRYVQLESELIQLVKDRPAWLVAKQIAKKMASDPYQYWPEPEIAYIAMHLLSASRNERWPGDLDVGVELNQTIDDLLVWVAEEYQSSTLTQDRVLRDGIVVHTIPAIFRKKFNLWFPNTVNLTMVESSPSFERKTAVHLVEVIAQKIGITPPVDEVENIALLLKAAVIREKSNEIGKVIVVCPSGMATAQLLVARLKAHFPRLRDLMVVSLRDIHQKEHAAARLIISTVPLTALQQNQATVIQVHPLLLPEDIEKITHFLNVQLGGDK